MSGLVTIHMDLIIFVQSSSLYTQVLVGLQEYQRCSHALKDSCEGKGRDKERFLKFYSLYLAGERRRQCAFQLNIPNQWMHNCPGCPGNLSTRRACR